jgi:2,6-dihydroxypyridine 3-monooxygenase
MGASPRAVVMGGSLGGLNAALWLTAAGWDVLVLEKSRSPLEGRGAGIVLHQATVRYLTEHGTCRLEEISARADRLVYLAADGSVAHTSACAYRFAGWNTLYRGMLERLAPERYRLGTEAMYFNEQGDGRVIVRLADGSEVVCDLLVAADGIASTARRLLLPDVTPRYAGYVAWRGTVERGHLSRATFSGLCEVITYYVMPASHILMYFITDDRLNWVWYRNVAEGAALDDLMTTKEGVHQGVGVPPGFVAGHHLDELRAAAQLLPPQLAEVVGRTAQPFIQAIIDVEVPRMAFGRICVMGDAAFALRPHAAAGTAKAAEDAWQLARAVEGVGCDVVEPLRRWETAQLALGRQVLARTRDAGNRSQFRGTWKVGDPLPFGLYRTGDSLM